MSKFTPESFLAWLAAGEVSPKTLELFGAAKARLDEALRTDWERVAEDLCMTVAAEALLLWFCAGALWQGCCICVCLCLRAAWGGVCSGARAAWGSVCSGASLAGELPSRLAGACSACHLILRNVTDRDGRLYEKDCEIDALEGRIRILDTLVSDLEKALSRNKTLHDDVVLMVEEITAFDAPPRLRGSMLHSFSGDGALPRLQRAAKKVLPILPKIHDMLKEDRRLRLEEARERSRANQAVDSFYFE